jgi:hypothetical protein
MKVKLLITPLLFWAIGTVAQSGNYVVTGAEATNFGTIDLATPTSKTWATFRGAAPGYFSAVNGTTFTGASDADNINGYVKKYGNTAFTFPVGTGTDLRSLAISGTIPSNSQFGTAWILGNPTSTTDPTDGTLHPVTSKASNIYSVNTTGQWDWLDISNSAAGIITTASLPNVSSFAPTNTLRLVGWNGTQWINLSATQGTSAASGNTENSTLAGTMQSGITAIGVGRVVIVVNVKVFLQGAYNSGLGAMTTTLNTKNLIPLSQPYNVAPWNYSGTEAVAAIPANVTDWILVELRNASNVLVDTRAAFVKNDGTIVDTDGTSTLQFVNQPEGTYHIAIRHRNHLTIRTPSVTAVNPTMPQYNYTSAQAQSYQDGTIIVNAATKNVSGTFVMWGGNGINNNNARASGALAVNDYTYVTNTVLGGSIALVLNNVYSNADYTMDGIVRASGALAVNDATFLTLNVLNGVISAVYLAHQ